MAPIPSETPDELETLERKHAENPEGRYFVPLANVYRRQGDVQRAISMLRDGLAKHPDYLSAHIVLGRCLADQGEAGGAEAEFRYVLSLDPQNLIALRTLGEISVAQGNATEGRKWYRELLVVDPMNEDARRALESLQAAGTAPAGTGEAETIAPAAPMAEEAFGEPAGAGGSDSTDYDTHFGTMIDFDEVASPGNAEGFDNDGDAVVTETIAELYTRQGFYDRAADVYRELIRRRGGDPSLEERLRRVEAMAAEGTESADSVEAASAGQAARHDDMSEPSASRLQDDAGGGYFEPSELFGLPAEPTPSPAPLEGLEVEVEDLFADSFTGGFPTDDPAESEEPLAPAGADRETLPSAEPEATETIATYLAAVFSWSPAESTLEDDDSAAPTESEAEAGEPVGIESIAGLESGYYGASEHREEASDAELSSAPTDESDWFASTSLDEADAEPEDSREVIVEEHADASLDRSEERPVVAPALDDEDLFPWEVPGRADAAVEEEVRSDESAGATAERVPVAEASPEPPADTFESTGEPAPPFEAGPAPPTEAEAPVEPEKPASEATSQEEEDDLESFQAWLRSLKR